jgi:hypothetical protein
MSDDDGGIVSNAANKGEERNNAKERETRQRFLHVWNVLVPSLLSLFFACLLASIKGGWIIPEPKITIKPDLEPIRYGFLYQTQSNQVLGIFGYP